MHQSLVFHTEGFTAWSSTRDPAQASNIFCRFFLPSIASTHANSLSFESQVFVLLQTVYAAFDDVAKRRRKSDYYYNQYNLYTVLSCNAQYFFVHLQFNLALQGSSKVSSMVYSTLRTRWLYHDTNRSFVVGCIYY